MRDRRRRRGAGPYARESTAAVEAVVSRSANINPPLTTEPVNPARAAVLVLTSDRGFAGGYNPSGLLEAQGLHARLAERGLDSMPFVSGRKGLTCHPFRGRGTAAAWTRCAEPPTPTHATQ